jgi:hypothetical protein
VRISISSEKDHFLTFLSLLVWTKSFDPYAKKSNIVWSTATFQARINVIVFSRRDNFFRSLTAIGNGTPTLMLTLKRTKTKSKNLESGETLEEHKSLIWISTGKLSLALPVAASFDYPPPPPPHWENSSYATAVLQILFWNIILFFSRIMFIRLEQYLHSVTISPI